MKVKYHEWDDKMGVTHRILDKTCVICKHSTDIWLDPFKGNEIYCVACELKEFAYPIDCTDFEYTDEYKDKEPKEMEVIE